MKQLTLEKIAQWVPTRKADSYKGNYGKILLVGGNKNMGGAIIMASLAALNSGAGLITTATAEENRSALHSHAPEVMFTDMYESKGLADMIQGMDTVLIGPGLGREESSKAVFQTVIDHVSEDQVIIMDGDAIHLYANEFNFPKVKAQAIFTPHLGEWKTLTGLTPEEENQEDNAQKQTDLNAVIILKKNRTQIYFDDEIWENTTGNPSMATGGMGDTLAGMVAGFSQQFSGLNKAILAAVFIHSYIGDQLAENHYVIRPTQISTYIPKTLRDLEVKNK